MTPPDRDPTAEAAPRPSIGEQVLVALDDLRDWVEGRQTWTNHPYPPEVVAVLDAQECVKRAALVQALAAVAVLEEAHRG